MEYGGELVVLLFSFSLLLSQTEEPAMHDAGYWEGIDGAKETGRFIFCLISGLLADVLG